MHTVPSSCYYVAWVHYQQAVPSPVAYPHSPPALPQVKKLDPKASDELLILAKGKSVESWKLADIKRDDYSPNPQVITLFAPLHET